MNSGPAARSSRDPGPEVASSIWSASGAWRGPGRQRPGEHRIAGGIADPGGAPVDDAGQSIGADEDVARQQVAVHPHGRAGPVRSRHRRSPDRQRPLDIDRTVQRGDAARACSS